MLKMEEFLLIRDLYNKGLNISEIARETGFDRKTVRKHMRPGCTGLIRLSYNVWGNNGELI